MVWTNTCSPVIETKLLPAAQMALLSKPEHLRGVFAWRCFWDPSTCVHQPNLCASFSTHPSRKASSTKTIVVDALAGLGPLCLGPFCLGPFCLGSCCTWDNRMGRKEAAV